MLVHHIGYLVKNMDQALQQFLDLGYEKTSHMIHDSYREVDICFLENNGHVVELVQPSNEESVVSKLIKKNGVSPYHICYITDSMEKACSDLAAKGYIMTAKPEVAPALGDKKVAFFYHKHVGLIEILEEI